MPPGGPASPAVPSMCAAPIADACAVTPALVLQPLPASDWDAVSGHGFAPLVPPRPLDDDAATPHSRSPACSRTLDTGLSLSTLPTHSPPGTASSFPLFRSLPKACNFLHAFVNGPNL